LVWVLLAAGPVLFRYGKATFQFSAHVFSIANMDDRYTAVTMMFIVVICGVGAWPASFAVVGETSSLRLRAKSQGISTIASDIASILFSFLLPYVYNKDAGNLGAKTGFLFFVICTITTAITWLTVPELKGRTNAEIDHMFKLGLPTRRFKSWSAANGTDDSEVLI
jgi:hypothetical protein